ncbi:MAG: hypothetical protein ACREX8_11630, partial [Gammaproteobacteria bacterium]
MVSTARLADIGELEYQAALAGRAVALRGGGPSPVVQRLRLQPALRLPTPKQEAPALERGWPGPVRQLGAGLPAEPALIARYYR